MADEDRSSRSGAPDGIGEEALAGWRVLDEQRARIDALRKALLADEKGGDPAQFDFESFFAGKPADDTPSS